MGDELGVLSMSWLKVLVLSLTAVCLWASPAKPAKKAEPFKAFTGKVLANKVRVRVKPDTESHIFRQVSKNDLFLVVGEEGDFYAIQPPKDTKAYVFRSYILDNVVEASRVNVRLEPHADGPIIGLLQAGDKVTGHPCPLNHKWFEISPPSSTRFYVSKELIGNAGGPELIATTEKRKKQVDELLNGAFLCAETECKKQYEEMNPQPIVEQFQKVIQNYSEFGQEVQQAKEALVLLKDTYLQKKIEYLESKAELPSAVKEELLARHKAENQEIFATPTQDKEFFARRNTKREATEKMRYWDAIEESLYLSWTAFHSGRKMDDFYAEAKANSTILSGTLEIYDQPVKNRPGDYILKSADVPVAYVYSTTVDLDKHLGKRVSLLASPRPNNHFAFPAYFILDIE
jgi:hypothetical protein